MQKGGKSGAEDTIEIPIKANVHNTAKVRVIVTSNNICSSDEFEIDVGPHTMCQNYGNDWEDMEEALTLSGAFISSDTTISNELFYWGMSSCFLSEDAIDQAISLGEDPFRGPNQLCGKTVLEGIEHIGLTKKYSQAHSSDLFYRKNFPYFFTFVSSDLKI